MSKKKKSKTRKIHNSNKRFSTFKCVDHSLLKMLKKLYKEDPEKFFDAVKSVRKAALLEHKDMGMDSDLFEGQMYLISYLVPGKYENYFLEDGLHDVLKNMKIPDVKNFSRLLKDDQFDNKIDKMSMIDRRTNKIVEASQESINIMIHSKDIDKSIMFSIAKSTIKNEDHISFFLWDGEDIASSSAELFEKGCLSEKIEKEFCLAINLFYYMHCYPEKVFNEPPFEVKDKNNMNNSYSLQKSDEIIDYINRGVSPHLRRGFFKYLGSDYYVNKKGQTVFVNPTFVKGRAKTIKE